MYLLSKGLVRDLVILVEGVEPQKRRRCSPGEERRQSHSHHIPISPLSLSVSITLHKYYSFQRCCSKHAVSAMDTSDVVLPHYISNLLFFFKNVILVFFKKCFLEKEKITVF